MFGYTILKTKPSYFTQIKKNQINLIQLGLKYPNNYTFYRTKLSECYELTIHGSRTTFEIGITVSWIFGACHTCIHRKRNKRQEKRGPK